MTDAVIAMSEYSMYCVIVHIIVAIGVHDISGPQSGINCMQSVHGLRKVSSNTPKPEANQYNARKITNNVIIAFRILFLTLRMYLRIKKIIEKSIAAGMEHITKGIKKSIIFISSPLLA